MQIEGTVKLKKVTLGGAIYAFSIPGAQTANMVVAVIPGKEPGRVGTIIVDIPEPEKPKRSHHKKK
jgi:hypothetical protein